MNNQEKELFVGIDLGGKKKKTTWICILEKTKSGEVFSKDCQNIFGREIFKKLSPYFKNTKVIAIDAPLTKGRGKGKMRLYEKFLSRKIFRKEKVSPLPPALMSDFCDFALEIREKLENKGFALDINLIETFPTLIKKLYQKNLFFRPLENKSCLRPQNKDQESALICAQLSFWHFSFKTRYLGYKDGFLFLPEFSFWKKNWERKFLQSWREKPYFNYRYLITNLF